MTAFKEKTATAGGKIHVIIYSVFWIAVCYLFFSNTGVILKTDREESAFFRIILFLAVLLIIALSFIYCLRSWLFRVCRKDEKGRSIPGRFGLRQEIAFACASVTAFFIVELINNSEKLFEMYWLYALMNILGGFIMINILMGWLNSFRYTLMIFLILSLAFSLVCYFVYLFRGEPFQLIDIFALGTAAEVAGGYTFSLTRWAAVMITLGLCAIAVASHQREYKWAFSLKAKVISRALVIAFMIFGYWAYMNLSWNSAMLGITTDLWAPHKTYEQVGTNMGFFCVAKFMKNDPPEGYSIDEVERVEEEFLAGYEPEESSEEITKPVNLIVIMNEAWADFTVFENFAASSDYMPFYNSMEENTIKGHTLVCIYGGGTAKTEYEFLTGNSVKQYPGMVPYVSYYTHDQYSIVTTLEANGYETAAMHPNKGTNWNRNAAYDYLGFEEFYTIDDFDASCEKLRGMVSDKANYEKIIQVIESREDPSKPFFLFDVTMQNHGGYGSDNYPITIEAQGLENEALNRYLSLARESDDALKYLIEYFEDYNEPTMIVMFGDHLPGTDQEVEKYLSGAARDDLDIAGAEEYYQTPFFIWTNYDIEEKSDVLTSTNFLGTMVMKTAGIRIPAFNNYILELMEEIQAYNHKGYLTKDGTYIKWDDASEEVKQKVLEYEYLQYNTLMEDSKRTDGFFTVGEEKK